MSLGHSSLRTKHKQSLRSWVLPGSLAIILALVVAGLPFGVIHSQAQDEELIIQSSALARIVHASPDAPAVDVYMDEELILEGLEFGQITEFALVPDGNRQIRVVPSGGNPDNQSLIDFERDFAANEHYIIAAVGFVNDIRGEVSEIDTGRIPETGFARIRVIHYSPDAGDVSVVRTDGEEENEFFGGVGFNETAGYDDFAAGTYDLEIRPADDDGVVLPLPETTFQAGYAYDVIAIGSSAQNTVDVVMLSTPTEQFCATALGITGANAACVQIVHGSFDAPSVDIYLEDAPEPTVTNAPYGSITDYLALPEGERRVRIVAAGSPVDEAIIDESINLDEGQAYTVLIMDRLENIELETFSVDLRPLGGEAARMRVIHAVPAVDTIDIITENALLFQDIGFRDAPDAKVVPPGAYTLEFRPRGDETEAVFLADVVAEPHYVTTVVMVGSGETEVSSIVLTAPVFGSPAQDEGIDEATPEPVLEETQTEDELNEPQLDTETPEAG